MWYLMLEVNFQVPSLNVCHFLLDCGVGVHKLLPALLSERSPLLAFICIPLSEHDSPCWVLQQCHCNIMALVSEVK